MACYVLLASSNAIVSQTVGLFQLSIYISCWYYTLRPYINWVAEYPTALPCPKAYGSFDSVSARLRDGVAQFSTVLRSRNRFAVPNQV